MNTRIAALFRYLYADCVNFFLDSLNVKSAIYYYDITLQMIYKKIVRIRK